jgi:hypothetical protein
MNIFYPEYLSLVIFMVIALWKIFRDDPDSDRETRKRSGDEKDTSGTRQKQ